MTIICDCLSTLLRGIVLAVPRAKLAGIGGLVCGVPRGSWANRGPKCGHVGLSAKNFNTPSQTKGPIILMRTPGLLAVVTGLWPQFFCTIFGGLKTPFPSYFPISVPHSPPVSVPKLCPPSAFALGVFWGALLEAKSWGNRYWVSNYD